MVDKRKGMSVAKLDLSVEVSKEMIDNHAGIYLADFKIEWGRDLNFAQGRTVYCHKQHDLTIEMLMSENGLNNKRVKKITLTKVKNVGESVAVTKPIKRWRITNEI